MSYKNVRYTGDNVISILNEYNFIRIKAYGGDIDALDTLYDVETLFNNAGLTVKQRQALEMYYKDDLTQQEIADKLGINRISVRESIKTAEDKVKRLADAWGGITYE